MELESLQNSLYTYQATCLRVVDGDTMDLDIDLGMKCHQHERVRLYGINTPETYGVKKDSEEWRAGMVAKARVIELVNTPGAQLWIRTHKDKTGKYGRYLATVYVVSAVGVVDLNALLVEEGLAEAREY